MLLCTELNKDQTKMEVDYLVPLSYVPIIHIEFKCDIPQNIQGNAKCIATRSFLQIPDSLLYYIGFAKMKI